MIPGSLHPLTPRRVFTFVLADVLAPRGTLTPLTPLWKLRRQASAERLLRLASDIQRRMRSRSDG